MDKTTALLKKVPEAVYTGASVSAVILSLGITISMIRSNSVDLAVANTRLQVSSKINQTTKIAKQLELQAIQLQQQQKQYLGLKSEYDRLLIQTNGQALKELKPVIEEIKVNDVELKEITDNLQSNQEELKKLVGQ